MIHTLPITQRPRKSPRRRSAFTLVEMIIVVIIIGISATLVVPMFGQTSTSRLRGAATMVSADLEYAQSESIGHADDLRVVVFNIPQNKYHLAVAADTTTPLTHPIDKQPYTTQFGVGRASHLTGVTLQSVSVGIDNTLGFRMYGQLDQTAAATVTLASDGATITITLDPTTGVATVGDIN